MKHMGGNYFSTIIAVVFCVSFCDGLLSDARHNNRMSCLGKDGQPIDWFVVYKSPKIHGTSDNLAKEGLKFLYLDSERASFSAYDFDYGIDDLRNPVALTLNQVYDAYQHRHGTSQEQKVRSRDDQDVGYIFYNDQAPNNKSSSSKAHAKGALAFDAGRGFWLISSVPHFPSRVSDGYIYPSSGHVKGQTMLCITIDTIQTADIIGKQLKIDHVNVFDSALPHMYRGFSNLIDVIDGKHGDHSVLKNTESISTCGNLEITSFAKTSAWNSTLYEGIVAPTLQSHLLAETWREGPGHPMESYCTQHYKWIVENVENMNLGNGMEFHFTKDHSKWAISRPGSSEGDALNWVCIGDINRMESQFRRGGGTACFQHEQVWSELFNLVQTIEKCP